MLLCIITSQEVRVAVASMILTAAPLTASPFTRLRFSKTTVTDPVMLSTLFCDMASRETVFPAAALMVRDLVTSNPVLRTPLNTQFAWLQVSSITSLADACVILFDSETKGFAWLPSPVLSFPASSEACKVAGKVDKN